MLLWKVSNVLSLDMTNYVLENPRQESIVEKIQVIRWVGELDLTSNPF